MAQSENSILVRKYFPQDWNDLILPTTVMETLKNVSKTKGYRLLMFSKPGTGKCLGKDTPILMYDGSIKMVQDIVVGDLLMGINSTPRRVLATTTGQEMLYKVEQKKGIDFVCNESHILSTVISGTYEYGNGKIPKQILDMNILNVLKLPQHHKYKLFKVPLNFDYKPIELDPYILGYWLGDGISSQPSITVGNSDIDTVLPYFEKYAESLNLYITLTNSKDSCQVIRFTRNCKYASEKYLNPFTEKLRKYNLINNKHIPKDYLLNSREVRLKLFAGLVDSDGGGSDKTYDFAFASKKLAEDVTWLARSLGYYVNCIPKIIKNVEYHRLIISGDFSDLSILHKRKYFGKRNQVKNPLVTGFKIKPIGIGDYYGFEIDGDKRFLLGDFTVTHNTSTSRIISKNDEVMYLSGSNDFKIDTLRNKVMGFASGMSINNKQKTIIIDEFENIRDDLQDAFKIILDKAVKVNFIFITNEVEKVNSAIKSRCTNLDYDFFGSDLEELRKKYVNFALKVGKTENIKYDADGMRELYKINFPDFRHLLVHMQQLIDSNKDITLENVKMFSESGKQIVELYSLIENPAITGQEFYLEMVKFKTKEKECLTSLGEPFFQYLNNKNLHSKTLEAAIVVSKYSDVYTRSINKFVTLLSCVIELKSLFR